MDIGKNTVTVIGEVNFRDDRRRFGIKRVDRRAHLYIVGKTGTGKSALLETLICQDIRKGEGVALLDPHGDLAERVVSSIPAERTRDLIYFNVPDTSRPLGFNPLERVPPAKRPLAAEGLLEVFKKIWLDSWGPRLAHLLRNALFALLDQPEATLAEILSLLDDPAFRKRAALRVANPHVRRFWLEEYAGYPARFRAEVIAPLQNKVGAFLADPLLQKILTARKSSFDLRRVMDDRKILVVNLAKGKIGEGTAGLLGALLVARIGLAGLSRAEVPEDERPDFYLYLDEFHTFATMSLATMLSELRKYRVNLILVHQYLSQLEPEVRDAILGNVGTTISFRLGAADAKILEQEFYPEFSASDLVYLPNYHIYLKLMVDGVVSKPFSARTMVPRASGSVASES